MGIKDPEKGSIPSLTGAHLPLTHPRPRDDDPTPTQRQGGARALGSPILISAFSMTSGGHALPQGPHALRTAGMSHTPWKVRDRVALQKHQHLVYALVKSTGTHSLSLVFKLTVLFLPPSRRFSPLKYSEVFLFQRLMFDVVFPTSTEWQSTSQVDRLCWKYDSPLERLRWAKEISSIGSSVTDILPINLGSLTPACGHSIAGRSLDIDDIDGGCCGELAIWRYSYVESNEHHRTW
ncbi:hypothetical protein K504DRAFT_501616 [Pleomassaria siparia CBS 279.74]|uniref:Uncharacterized protein n=1 Tax=Pleomassaria siparia CBS 279.74 TaxID=1314801 RepID=A0A6G1KC09_9PLEO|nr:hypothetical protein K504DRAFT_501616 [Pleomassaria siparia CBS 279.74]